MGWQWGCRLERTVRTRVGDGARADPIARHDVRRDPGLGRIRAQKLMYPTYAGAMEAKSRIAGVLSVLIDSVDRSAACAGLGSRGTGGSS